MTRKEEIQQAAENYKRQFPDGYVNEQIYIEGAEWADKNPSAKTIAEFLHEEKGYPITLNGEIPTFEEAMKNIQLYNAHLKKQLETFVSELKSIISEFATESTGNNPENEK